MPLEEKVLSKFLFLLEMLTKKYHMEAKLLEVECLVLVRLPGFKF